MIEQKLTVRFDTEHSKTIYEGRSYLKKNLQDRILIADDEICIIFARGKRKDGNLLDESNSLIRYQLQKALCFYLITQGTLPKVRSVEFDNGKKTIQLDHSRYTKSWEDCDISILMSPEKASVIFTDYKRAKDLYISITYLIKAQLCKFSNDSFRNAWTAVNSVYRVHKETEDEKEWSQINKLRNIINTTRLSAEDDSVLFDETFWSKLEWYTFTNRTGYGVNNMLDGKRYADPLLIRMFLKEYDRQSKVTSSDSEEQRQRKNNLKEEVENARKRNRRKLEEGKPVIKERVEFLVCDYCYMLRNRNYHAAKAYPVFVISEEAETGIERTLSSIMLKTVRDILESELH